MGLMRGVMSSLRAPAGASALSIVAGPMSLSVPDLDAAAAFQAVVDALEPAGVALDPEGGAIVDAAGAEIGRIMAWRPGAGVIPALREEEWAAAERRGIAGPMLSIFAPEL